MPTTSLAPGSTGTAVQQLQNWLVSQGYMTQAQVNSGYGTYGPQTTAAVLAFQKASGIDYSSGPGYWGPKTIAAAQSGGQPVNAQSVATGQSVPGSITTSSGTPIAQSTTTGQPVSGSITTSAPTPISGYQGVSAQDASALAAYGIDANQWNGTISQYGSSSNPFSSQWLNSARQQYANSPNAGRTSVTLGSGAKAYVDTNGVYYDENGTKIPDGVISGSTAGSLTKIDQPTTGIKVGTTGDAGLDQILGSIKGLAESLLSSGYTIPANLQITPALVSQFLTYAHQAIDPYTQQLLSSRLADVNANLKAQATNYQNSADQRVQQFGTDLSSEQNTAGAAGTAFSGQRNINELNLTNTANRDLSTLGATAAYNIGTTARAGASDVGSANAGSIVLPTLANGSVSLSGGQRGSTSSSGPLSYNYDPSLYKVGTIPSNQAQAVNQQQQNYLSQYGTLAGATSNSGRSVSDLFGMMSGLPSGYSVPSLT